MLVELLSQQFSDVSWRSRLVVIRDLGRSSLGVHSFRAFYRVVKVPGTIADSTDPNGYCDTSFFDYRSIVFAVGRSEDHSGMKNVNLADASKEVYTRGLHVLQIGCVVYVSGDIQVAKLYGQPDSELPFQSSRYIFLSEDFILRQMIGSPANV